MTLKCIWGHHYTDAFGSWYFLCYLCSVLHCYWCVRPPSHLTNMSHLSAKGLNINLWMERPNSSSSLDKQFCRAVLMENPSFLITYVFQGYHIINATCLAEVFLVTEVWMCDWFIFPITAAKCALLTPLPFPAGEYSISVIFSTFSYWKV